MEPSFTLRDEDYMREAIALAKNGEGRVSPNPPVGCVLVKDDVVIACGWHDRLGDLHAEAMALREAGDAAKGATAYVTLSPCTSHGRQPPCSNALIRAGVAEVIVGAGDPNPSNTTGIAALNAAGIPARAGCLRDEAEYVARGFFKVHRKGLPWVTVKYAMTLDGKIAARTGDSRWVSGEESRELVQDMRSRCDAVMVGSGTVLADDPLLNTRDPAWSARGGAARHRQPLRVLVDGGCRLSPGIAMLSSSQPGGGVVVACGCSADGARVEALRAAGADVVTIPGPDGHVDLRALLEGLARRGVNQVLCEGGGGLAGALLEQGLLDEVAVFVAPKIIGGAEAPGPVAGVGFGKMAEAAKVSVRECIRVGGDMFVLGVLC